MKILNIGLSKTGTTSLHHALNQLGIRSAHHEQHFQVRRGQGTWFEGDFSRDDLVGFDAACDLPIATYYAELDERYPGSKFILTTRPVDAWLDSVRRHWLRHPLHSNEWGEYRRMLRLSTYGITGFSPSRMRRLYERHTRQVQEYFAGREADLLVLSLFDSDGWEELCAFLKLAPPDAEFPWQNRDRGKKRQES